MKVSIIMAAHNEEKLIGKEKVKLLSRMTAGLQMA